ncbi:MAG: xanthine dehydrogenase molybdopterin binding subunit [Acidiferrobacterales bacterium]|nr:xanthine dehydrogenase molybdopterin binding subunit [Acidiferrobacterales bacterium]
MLDYVPDKNLTRTVRHPVAHDSAVRHVTGEACYVDDVPEPRDLLHVWAALSPHASARIISADLRAVSQSPGVVGVFDAESIPGVNECSPTVGGDPVFAQSRVDFAGQVLFAVAAQSEQQARDACRQAHFEYELEEPVLTVKQALDRESYVLPASTIQKGDPQTAIDGAANRISGLFECGGQDHFYLEGQAAMAIPREGGDFLIHSSTQHPSEVQHLVAKVLDIPFNAVQVEVRRMGGAFGGKESQAAQWACIAAIVAKSTGRPAKMRLDRDTDMLATGKRHDFRYEYEVGFDEKGRIQGLKVDMASRCGYSADLSGPINDRALLHLDNAYYLDNVIATTRLCRTNTVSNTAFRGFGGPQGMLCIERIIDEIACHLNKDPLQVRRLNFYRRRTRNITPYGMRMTGFEIRSLVSELVEDSNYHARRIAIRRANRAGARICHGIALTPVKFGISFTATHFNQAHALVHVYTDGSIHLNHGGTEMGQGLFIKVAQVVAEEFSVPLSTVKIAETNTSRVPNTSATAASSGSDVNGKAAQDAARKIKDRLCEVAARLWNTKPAAVQFTRGQVVAGRDSASFAEVVRLAHASRVPLSATGHYRTPKINWDRTKMQGRPFFYFGTGAAVSEVAVDRLTGEYRLSRVDILHDVGQSLNPAVDLGQIEGGFVQGAGWLTSEELWWDDSGNLKTHAPSTYKIPTAGDVPEQFNVRIWTRGRNQENTIYRSKAVGEPPLMLAISVYSAICDAISSLSGYKVWPHLDAPATPERVIEAISNIQAGRSG